MLTLTITSNSISIPEVRKMVKLDKGSLTIGRALDNNWVLPDPTKFISRYHCVITENQGQYQLLDIGNNGVFINNSDHPLGHENQYILCQNDHIQIGEYMISVALDSALLVEETGPILPLIGTEKDWMPIGQSAEEPPKLNTDQQPEVQRNFPPPPLPLPDISNVISGETDIFLAVRELILGAKLDPDNIVIKDPVATLHELGELLRIVVVGVIDLLRARRTLKSEFGLEQTEIKATNNNPLKFSLSIEETLKMLFTGPQQGYLHASAAFEEVFTDLKIHQLATLAGMQEAWNDLLKRFDPQALEKRIGEDRGLQGLIGSRKIRCWDAFTLLYQSLLEDIENNHENLFVRKFAKGYREQVEKNQESKFGLGV